MRVNPKPWICHRFKIRQNDFFNIQRHDIVKIVIIYISAGYGRDDVSSDVRILTLRGKYFSYNFIPQRKSNVFFLKSKEEQFRDVISLKK